MVASHQASYSLEPADAAASSKDASMMLQRQATSNKLANLKISAPPGECVVALLGSTAGYADQ